MSDFSPDMEKNNTSKLNTEMPDTDTMIPASSEDDSGSAEEKPTGDTVPYSRPVTTAELVDDASLKEGMTVHGKTENDSEDDEDGTDIRPETADRTEDQEYMYKLLEEYKRSKSES